MSDKAFESWAILELMGHRRLAGYVQEVELAGEGFLRIDVVSPDGKSVTQYYRPGAIYGITPTTEETVRAVAGMNQPAPVSRWELPMPSHEPLPEEDDFGDGEDEMF